MTIPHLDSASQENYAIQAWHRPDTLPLRKVGKGHFVVLWFGCQYHIHRLSSRRPWGSSTWMWVLFPGEKQQECGVGFKRLHDVHNAVIVAIRRRIRDSSWQSPFFY